MPTIFFKCDKSDRKSVTESNATAWFAPQSNPNTDCTYKKKQKIDNACLHRGKFLSPIIRRPDFTVEEKKKKTNKKTSDEKYGIQE